MEKSEKITIPVSVSAAAQQVYLLGTYNPDNTLLLLSVAFVCYIPGPPEGVVVSVAGSDQTKTNIARNGVFSLNLCTVEMKDLAEAAWFGYSPTKNGGHLVEYCNGNKLNVPVLNASPNNLECKVSQSLQVGDTTIFICETPCIQADSTLIPPYPESGSSYSWYENTDAKKFDPLLYSFKYYTLSESIGQIGIKW